MAVLAKIEGMRHSVWYTPSNVQRALCDFLCCAVPPAAELWRRLQDQTRALVGAITQSGILLPSVFVFLWQVRGFCLICSG